MFAGMIISPEDIRNLYADNLLGGLAMQLAGPELLKLMFHIFVVIVGVLILSGAVNTSIIGANGVLNRVAEDGVFMLDWFRKPHKRFGTTHAHGQHSSRYFSSRLSSAAVAMFIC